MAVASDHLPRFSLLTGTSGVYARAQTKEIEDRLVRCLSGDFTCEGWLQIRTINGKQAPRDAVHHHACWWIHTPLWACGVTSDGQIVVCCDGDWRTSASSAERQLQSRQWYHVAAARRACGSACELSVDGEPIQLEPLQDPDRLRLPMSPSAGFRIGWTPMAVSPCCLLLHEMKLWSVSLPASAIQRWLKSSISVEQPSANHLVARWSFSSDAMTPPEYDLSGFGHDIVVENVSPRRWLQTTPPSLHHAASPSLVRLITLQDAEKSRFVIELNVLPEAEVTACRVYEIVTVVLVLNFLCFPNPSVASKGKGMGLMLSLQAFVQKLPRTFRLVIYDKASGSEEKPSLVLLCASLDNDSKARARKVLDEIVIKKPLNEEELGQAIVNSVQDVEMILQQNETKGHSFVTVLAITESTLGESNQELLSAIDDLQTRHLTVTVNMVQVGSSESSPSSTAEPLGVSPFVNHFVHCESDFEWVLAVLLSRVQKVVLTGGELVLEAVGPAKFYLTNESSPVFHRRMGTTPKTRMVVSMGSLSLSDRLILTGVADFATDATQDLLLIATTFSYCTSDGRRHIVRASLRPVHDMTDHYHIEYATRNKQLRITDDEAQLFQQRRVLMRRKTAFVRVFVAQEIADAENTFKKINIMKEELWARRKWILGRGSRLLEEAELQHRTDEASVAKVAFASRIQALQATMTSSSRGAESRGASREASRGKPLQRIRLDPDPGPRNVVTNTGDEEDQESNVDRLTDVCVKLSVQTKTLNEHEAKMEDLFVSVRIAEAKGPVIMNDTRRNWVARFYDMIKTKKVVNDATLMKQFIEWSLAFYDEQLTTRQEVEAEVQATNVALARVENELSKRRKRALLCATEIVGSVVDEVNASERVDTATRDLARARLMKTLALTPDMYVSCIYVCFPIEVSELEVPTTKGHARAFATMVHGLCTGLRHMCDATSESPVCRRLSLSETFLWWGLEQQSVDSASDSSSNLEGRRAVQDASWAVVVVSYNTLFSSAVAMSEVKATLATARDQAKPVFYIQLETPLDGLDAFRSQWIHRREYRAQSTVPTLTPSVEREFLTWKQNFASFQALLNAVQSVETVVVPPHTLGGCCHGSTTEESWFYYPCLECLWPTIVSSRQKTVEDSDEDADSQQDRYRRWIFRLVCRLGAWVDEIVSVSLQTAPRSYHIDPSAVSLLSQAWEASLQAQVRHMTEEWNEVRLRRTKEIHRQIGKLFKVYEEEARDLVAARFKLCQRKLEVLRDVSDRLNQFIDERKLLETWLEKLVLEEKETESGRQGNETEQMTSEELWQQIHHSESVALHLEAMEDLPDAPPKAEIAQAKTKLDAALRRSSRAILELGRAHIEDQYQSLLRTFKQKELVNQIKIAQAKCDEQQVQIGRIETVFDEAQRLSSSMHEQRDAFIVEDAIAFFNASCLEVRATPSITNAEGDQHQLRKLASDLDFHATTHATILSQVFQAHLASSTAVEYRAKVRDATGIFLQVYSPRIGDVDDFDSSTVAGLKDVCHFVPDEPVKTWESLLAMRSLIDKEALEDREVQRVWGEWQRRFMEQLMAAHTHRWWTQCHTQLHAIRDRLHESKSALARSFEHRCTSERAFQQAVANREHFARRLAILQRRLVEARQRQQSLLQLLQIARKCYETSSMVMEGKLQSVKTDAIFKAWSRISEYHVGLVGHLFDGRSQCSHQLDALDDEIKNCEQSLASCDETIASKHQAWLQHSIADNMACMNAESQQDLAHETVELIISLEQQRVFQQFRVLDPRSTWLTLPVLSKWHKAYGREDPHRVPSSIAGGKGDVDGRGGVDDLLVQLSIARLDVIKQEKWRDSLQRKLHVLERIFEQQVELRHTVEREAKLYHALGTQLTERVAFLRAQFEASGLSEFLRLETQDKPTSASSIDRHGVVHAVRESRDQINVMIASAQQDYLGVEATACRIAWRMQEHIACAHRGERAIDHVKVELAKVETYLHVLKTKDQELFELRAQSEGHARDKTTDCEASTNPMGMDLATGRAVFEHCARDQWCRSCLSQTTTLGEQIKSLREVLASFVAIQRTASRPGTAETERSRLSTTGEAEDDGAEDDQLLILEQELRNAELLLLLNRFESRRAEATSEALQAAITSRFETATANRDFFASGNDRRDLDAVLSVQTFHSRMFSVGVYTHDREQLLALLREVATRFDPRDVAGNLSEVIFGASLDRTDLELIFMLQSKAHVDEQWQVALVVLFFARLFRRAALKKAAAQRLSQASTGTQEMLRVVQDRQHAAKRIMKLGQPLQQPHHGRPTGATTSDWVRDLLQHVAIDVEITASTAHLRRVGLGILLQQPLHRVLSSVMHDAARAVGVIADELEQQRAVAEYRPPKPTRLQVLMKDKYTLKVEWRPITMDQDLHYVIEICEQEPDQSTKRYWNQFRTTEKTTHTFYNLHPGHSYWIRVRSGFSQTKLGAPCIPILVTTLSKESIPS